MINRRRRRRPYIGAGHNLITDRSISSELTFTRASIKNYFNSAGLLTQAAINEIAYEYNPATLAYKGISLETLTKTNLLLWNRDFTNAAWVKTNGTAAKTATGLDGVVNSASTLTATSANATFVQTITAAASSRAFAFYVRRVTGTGNIQITQDGSSYTTVTVTSAWTLVTPLVASQLNATPGIRIVTNGDVIEVDYAQFETGSFTTSPIATTTVAVARSADVLSVTSINTKTWFNPIEGTLCIDFQRARDVTGLFTTFLSLNDGTSNEQIRMYGLNTTASNVTLEIIDGGVTVYGVTVGNAGANITRKAAIAYRLNDSNNGVSGSSGTTDTSCTMPTVTTLQVGIGPSANSQFYGNVKYLVYYPQRLANADLARITGV